MNLFVTRITKVGKSGSFAQPSFFHKMQSYSVSVPCKSYIKKYFSSIYGGIIELNHRSDFGDTILTKMSSTSLAQANCSWLNMEFQHYNEKICFKLSLDFFYRLETELTPQQVYSINRYLENCFKADLFMTILLGTFFGVEMTTVVEKFADKFDINLGEELTQKSLLKSYYRYRKTSTAKNFFLLQMSTPFNLSLRS